MHATTFPIRLKDAYMITPKVKHFVFECDGECPFDYLPGQFITIHFNHHDKILKRSYSIANAPQKNNIIEFAAGFFENGPGTKLLYHLQTGDIIQATGPYGRLILKDDTPTRYIFVATSTGITPYRAMLPELRHRLKIHPNLYIVILLGVQRHEDILYANELNEFALKESRVCFYPYLSRTLAHELQNNERLGYVQHAFPHLQLNSEQDLVYLCGNPGMIDEAFDYLKDQGFAMQRIIREKYISR